MQSTYLSLLLEGESGRDVYIYKTVSKIEGNETEFGQIKE